MKRKVAMFTCLLVLASVCSAGVLVGDFENSMDGWWAAGSNPGDTAAPSQSNATVGEWSLEGHIANGGWVEVAEVALLDRTDGAALRNALGTIGQITLDATSFYNTGSSNDYHQICILINCNGLWTVEGYLSMEASGVAGSYTIQLSEATMAAIAAADSYVNIGLLTNSSGTETETDGITGEVTVVFDGAITTYFDNVQIVPEPATLSLLGIGMLSLIRRKK